MLFPTLQKCMWVNKSTKQIFRILGIIYSPHSDSLNSILPISLDIIIWLHIMNMIGFRLQFLLDTEVTDIFINIGFTMLNLFLFPGWSWKHRYPNISLQMIHFNKYVESSRRFMPKNYVIWKLHHNSYLPALKPMMKPKENCTIFSLSYKDIKWRHNKWWNRNIFITFFERVKLKQS